MTLKHSYGIACFGLLSPIIQLLFYFIYFVWVLCGPGTSCDMNRRRLLLIVTQDISESIHILANEPSLALYRLQEHVTKSVPEIMDKKRELMALRERVMGASHDMEYALGYASKRLAETLSCPHLR